MAWRLYNWLDRRRVNPERDPLANADSDGSATFDGIDILQLRWSESCPGHGVSDAALARLRAMQLDVLLVVGTRMFDRKLRLVAHYGLWSLQYGDSDRFPGSPPYFGEIREHAPVSMVTLRVLTAEAAAELILAKAFFPTDASSLARNRVAPYFSSGQLVNKKLRELHDWGWPRLLKESIENLPRDDGRAVPRPPGNLEVLQWLAPGLARKPFRRTARALRPRDDVVHWRIAVRTGHRGLVASGVADMSGFQWIESPKGHYYADPFVLERNGRTWLFFEDLAYPTRRGTIACAEITPGGQLTAPQQVRISGRHLSYPCVFRDGAEIYMIPETSADGGVRLYRATDFPLEWEFVAELYSGAAVDTSVWEQGGRWWFFTTLYEPRGNSAMLMLFHAESVAGLWVSHPANPISLDARNARGGGAIFRQGDRLIRPSQDCSRSYGHGFALNEILTLSIVEYEERPIVMVGPGWEADLLGTHTYGRSGSVEVTDGKVRRSRKQVA